jgi:general secretion pathway protein L
MNILLPIREGFYRWIDSVAGTIDGLLNRLQSNHEVRIIEEVPDTFRLHAPTAGRQSKLPDHRIRILGGAIKDRLPADWAKMLRGSRTEIVLHANRFLFRPLELPKRAVEFLDGIVRGQIDRLTPWAPGEAVFGWAPPTYGSNDRIELVVAATARALVAPYLQAIAGLGAASVALSTVPTGAEPDAAPIKVFEQRARGMFEIDRIRRVLVMLFLISGIAAAITMGYSAFALDSLDAQQQSLSQKVAARRAALRTSPEFTASAQRMLERRKQSTPSNVIVIEALSQILPDHTYVTELRIEVDKLQIVGVTRDAAGLIGLIEQSPHFTRAKFYAPTTRTPGEPGERFHIEAQIKPIFTVGT